jgi:putative sporulation protein YyaC
VEDIMPEKLIINVNDTCVREIMCNYITRLLKRQQGLSTNMVIILCIGSDRYIGDALGPLVGSYLAENTECIIYGSLEQPVHAGNLVEVIAAIQQQYDQPIIIAVDACLGKSNEIGNVEIWQGSLEAGIAVGARLPCIGHISIIGVVNASGCTGYLDLQNTPLSGVVKLSKCIGSALGDALNAMQISNAVYKN